MCSGMIGRELRAQKSTAGFMTSGAVFSEIKAVAGTVICRLLS
jgi:hypothetical protein